MSSLAQTATFSDFRESFDRDGFKVVRGLATKGECQGLKMEVDAALHPAALGPLEYEAEVGYPGAPKELAAQGGGTPRRLLHACSRGMLFRDWAQNPAIVERMCELMGEESIALVQSHHNCIMTKYPNYGSETGWHQDIRYWSYEQADLINAWLALGPERRDNGGMRVIPGSHRLDFDADQFDEAKFFRADLEKNQPLLNQAIDVELDAGDVLFFHCRLLHAAGRNASNELKRSLVYTYNPAGNKPLPDTRSARLPQIVMD